MDARPYSVVSSKGRAGAGPTTLKMAGECVCACTIGCVMGLRIGSFINSSLGFYVVYFIGEEWG